MQTVNGRRKWASQSRPLDPSPSEVPQLKSHIRSSSTSNRIPTEFTPYVKQSKKIPRTIYTDDLVAPNLINSTKSNLRRNLDLRLLFRKDQQKKPHPFLRLINKSPYKKTLHDKTFQINAQDISIRNKQQTKYQNKHQQYNKVYRKEHKQYFNKNYSKQYNKDYSKQHSKGYSKEHSKEYSKQHIRPKREEYSSSSNKNKRDEYYSKPKQYKAKKQQYKQYSKGKKQEPRYRQYSKYKKEQLGPKENEQQTVKIINHCSQDFGLTEQQQQTFGARFPFGFDKLKLLGRGGFSLVWLGRHSKSGKQFAIKQIRTQNTHQTHIKQIWFGTMFFTLGGVPKQQYSHQPGIANLVRMYSYQMNQTDTWIFYQKCGTSLGNALYDIKAEKVYGGQKLYKIFYKPLYEQFSKNPKLIEKLTKQLCRSLALLAKCEIVHSDLKTQNILIKSTPQLQLSQIKLIDYGSAFQFKNIAQFSMATPEYMPPEILNYIIHENEGEYEEELYEKVMREYKHPWVVDIWSLGCVLLEIVVGVPLWMSLPLLVPGKGQSHVHKEGLFAVKGRLFPDIIRKQRDLVNIIDTVLQQENYSRIVLSPKMKSILKRMLTVDFNARISPLEVIQLLES